MFNCVSTVPIALGRWESLQSPSNSSWSFGGIYFLLENSEVGLNKFQAKLLSFSSVLHVTSLSEVLDMVSIWLPAKHLLSWEGFISSLLECRAKPLVLLDQTSPCVCFFRILLNPETKGQKLIDINKVGMRYLYLTWSLQL